MDKILNLTAFPVNDRRVYIDKSNGIIFERVGVVVKLMDGDNTDPFSSLYVDERGCVMTGWNGIKEDFCEAYEKLGKVGDTFTPFDISRAIDINISNHHGDIEDVIDMAESYFVIDKSGAEDTVKIRITVDAKGRGSFSCESKWYGFPEIKGVNLDDPEYCSKCYDRPIGLTELLVKPLAFYSRYLGRPIGLDIDFDNFYDIEYREEMADDEIQLRNDEIDIYRRKYLSKIREYISSEFAKVRNEWKVSPEVLTRRKAVKEKYEYANQDRVVMPLPMD